jgi:hypothetical protein
MAWSSDLHLGPVPAPTLLIDADLNVEIARRFLPEMTDPAVIKARRNGAEIEQITDSVVSMNKIDFDAKAPPEKHADGEGKRRKNRRRELRALVECEAARHRPAEGTTVLAVSYQGVHEWMATLRPIEGVEWTHFGAIRGKDRWKDVRAVIIAGRPQPSVEAIEPTARALFWKDPRPIAYIEPDSQGGKRFPTETRTYRGHRFTAEIEIHPDPLCRIILTAIREDEIVQAIDRARLIHNRPEACRVIILTKIVLPLTVHRLTTWPAIMPSRVELAFVRSAGVLPLGKKWLSTNLPDIFGSEETAKREVDAWLAEQKGQTPIYNTYRGLTLLVSYRTRPTGGRSTRALIRRDLAETPAALEALLRQPRVRLPDHAVGGDRGRHGSRQGRRAEVRCLCRQN